MSESLEKGASVTSVSATDNDIGVNARLTYTLAMTLTSWPCTWNWDQWPWGERVTWKQYGDLQWPSVMLTWYTHWKISRSLDLEVIDLDINDFGMWPTVTFSDLGVNARLTYTLAERDREYFYISTVDATNTGVIKVFKVRHTSTRLFQTTVKPHQWKPLLKIVKILIICVPHNCGVYTSSFCLICWVIDVNYWQ